MIIYVYIDIDLHILTYIDVFWDMFWCCDVTRQCRYSIILHCIILYYIILYYIILYYIILYWMLYIQWPTFVEICWDLVSSVIFWILSRWSAKGTLFSNTIKSLVTLKYCIFYRCPDHMFNCLPDWQMHGPQHWPTIFILFHLVQLFLAWTAVEAWMAGEMVIQVWWHSVLNSSNIRIDWHLHQGGIDQLFLHDLTLTLDVLVAPAWGIHRTNTFGWYNIEQYPAWHIVAT